MLSRGSGSNSDRESVRCLASKRARVIGSRKQKIVQKSSPLAEHRTCPHSCSGKDIREPPHFYGEIKCLQPFPTQHSQLSSQRLVFCNSKESVGQFRGTTRFRVEGGVSGDFRNARIIAANNR